MAGLPISSDPLALQFSASPVAAVLAQNPLRAMRNVARYSEDLSWANNVAGGSAVKTGARKTAVVGGRAISMQAVSVGTTFADSIETRYSNASLTPFATGALYLQSQYVACDTDASFYLRSVTSSSAQGHGVRFVRAGTMRRVWQLVRATSATAVDSGVAAEVALGSGAGTHPRLVQAGLPAVAKMLFIGGVQYDAVPPGTKNGIALIGDSTMAGASGKLDLPKDLRDPNNWEVSTHLGAALNCDVFNRGVGGDKLSDIDARFNADVATLFARSKYLIVQGGINDINNGDDLATCQARLLSIIAKAETAGWLLSDHAVKFLTVTPFASIAAVPAREAVRQQYNAWLRTTFGADVYDIDAVVRSPWDPAALHPAFIGDGGHYPGIAKEAIAAYIVAQGGFEFVQPEPYQPQLDGSSVLSAGGAAAGAAVTSVAASATNVQILAANPARKGRPRISYDGSDILYLRLGSIAATSGLHTVKLTGAGLTTWAPDADYTGAIQGIWSGTNGAALVTELS